MYINERFRKKLGRPVVDAYSLYAIAKEVEHVAYGRCVNVLHEADVLEFDDEAISDQRAEICGKITDYDFGNKCLLRDLLDLFANTEEMRVLRDLHKTLSNSEKYKEEFAKLDLNWMMTEFAVLHQIVFNNAIVGSIQHSAYPLTDDPLFLRVLEIKTRHLSRIKTSTKSQDLSPLESTLANAKNQMIASEAFNLSVPYFYKIPIEQIVEIRQNEKRALRNFLREIQKVNALVEGSKWDEELERKIQKTVNDEIRKRVIDIQEAMRNAYYDTVKKVGEAEIAVATAGLAGLVLQGIPSFLAVLGASSLYAIKSIWSYFVEKEKLKENSLYYMFKISKLQDRYLDA